MGIVYPLRRRIERKVGVVENAQSVIMEDVGRVRWKNVPEKAWLYADAKDMRTLFERGEVVRNSRVNFYRKRKQTSWTWEHPDGHRHTVSHLRGMLEGSAEQKLDALLPWIEFVRENGGTVGGIGSMSNSLWRSTLPQPLVLREHPKARGMLIRGERTALQNKTLGGHVFHNVSLWDMTASYASTLGGLVIPQAWRGKVGGNLPKEPWSFVRAIVDVPWLPWGPLPIAKTETRLEFPSEGHSLHGIWPTMELRAAIADGADVTVLESWTADGSVVAPFKDWYALHMKARETLPEQSIPLVKASGNAFIGTVASRSRGMQSWMRNGTLHESTLSRPMIPLSLTLHALVTGTVRTRLYSELLSPFPLSVLSCDTDGALVSDPVEPLDLGIGKGVWRKKWSAEFVRLLHPQMYARSNGEGGGWTYTFAGSNEAGKARQFDWLWGRKRARIEAGK